jgi:hypothetical protein
MSRRLNSVCRRSPMMGVLAGVAGASLDRLRVEAVQKTAIGSLFAIILHSHSPANGERAGRLAPAARQWVGCRARHCWLRPPPAPGVCRRQLPTTICRCQNKRPRRPPEDQAGRRQREGLATTARVRSAPGRALAHRQGKSGRGAALVADNSKTPAARRSALFHRPRPHKARRPGPASYRSSPRHERGRIGKEEYGGTRV